MTPGKRNLRGLPQIWLTFEFWLPRRALDLRTKYIILIPYLPNSLRDHNFFFRGTPYILWAPWESLAFHLPASLEKVFAGSLFSRVVRATGLPSGVDPPRISGVSFCRFVPRWAQDAKAGAAFSPSLGNFSFGGERWLTFQSRLSVLHDACSVL